MPEYTDVEQLLRKYDDAYDRVRRLKALCHDDDVEAGRWLWEAFRKGEDVVDENWYWGLLESGGESCDLGDLADLLVAIGKNPAALAQLDDGGWHHNLNRLLEQKFDPSNPRLAEVFRTIPAPLDIGLGYALASRGALEAVDLPPSGLATIADTLTDGITYDSHLQTAVGVFGLDALGPALAESGSKVGVSIWSSCWIPLAIPHANPAQRAQLLLNLDYASTAVEMADIVAEHYTDDDYLELERKLVDVVDLPQINYWQPNAPLQKLGFATAAIALARHAERSGGTLGSTALKAWGRAIENVESDARDAIVAAFQTLPLAEREALLIPLFEPSQEWRSPARWALLSSCQTPVLVQHAVRVIREMPRGEPGQLRYVQDAFSGLGAGVAETLVEAGWDKSPQREVIAIGLAATGSPVVIDRLIELLEDGLEGVRVAATDGLRQQMAEARDRLLAALTSRKKTVRLGAAEALVGASLSDAEREAVEALAAKEKIAEVEIALRAVLDGDSEEAGEEAIELVEVDSEAVSALADTLYATLPNEGEDFDLSLWQQSIGQGDVFLRAALRTLQNWWVSSEHRAEAWSLIMREAVDSPGLVPTALEAIDDRERSDIQTATVILAGLRDRLGADAVAPVLAHLSSGGPTDDDTLDWLAESGGERAFEWAQDGFLAGARWSAELLARFGERGRSAIAEFLSARRADVRLRAIEALMIRPSAELKPLFAEALEADRSEKVKSALRAALYELEVSDRTAIQDLRPTASVHEDLDTFLASSGTPAPKGTDLAALPPLRWTSGAQVSDGAVGWILSRVESEGPGDTDVQALRRHLEPDASTDFLAALRKQHEGSKEARLGWVLSCTAVFAADSEMIEFGRELDDEARYGSSTEAFRKLAILQYHRAPAALQWIDHWSRRAKSRGLRERAEQSLHDLASELGISAAELSERAMSDYGFNDRGQQTLAWGARGNLTLSLGPNNEIQMHDETGKLWKNYPGALKDDDAEAIKALKAEVSNRKKEVKQATKGQVERMEYAMASGREWAPEDWLGVYLANPLISNLAQHILWCAFDADGSCHGFRVADDLSLADINDDAFELAGRKIRVAHPYYLGQAATREWSGVFADYELIPPFEQFERPLFVPDETELEYSQIRRFEDARVPASSFRGHMERRGWVRGAPQDGGAVMWMTKAFPGSDVTAVAWVDPGFSVASYDDWSDDQAVEKIEFISGARHDVGWRVKALGIADVEPVVFSEVILDLERLYRG